MHNKKIIKYKYFIAFFALFSIHLFFLKDKSIENHTYTEWVSISSIINDSKIIATENPQNLSKKNNDHDHYNMGYENFLLSTRPTYAKIESLDKKFLVLKIDYTDPFMCYEYVAYGIMNSNVFDWGDEAFMEIIDSSGLLKIRLKKSEILKLNKEQREVFFDNNVLSCGGGSSMIIHFPITP